MNRKLIISILICILLILCKYYFSNYSIEYEVGNYKIKENYSKKRFYYEIQDGNYTYNFDYYKNRSLSKKQIRKIEDIISDGLKCITFKIKDVDTYPLCYENGTYTDYSIIENELLDQYKSEKIIIDKKEKDFSFNNNLNNDEYIALWNYKGYILMHGKEYKNIDIFDKDRYDNSLSYLYGNTIFMADYNSEYEYKKIYTFNLLNEDIKEYDLEYTIDFDSYFVGSVNKNIYIFDNKNSILYELNTKNMKMKIKCNNETGFVKYENGEFVSCSKVEYKVDKIKYDKNDSIYNYSKKDGLTYKIISNSKIKELINREEINIVSEYRNEIYYYLRGKFYKYTPNNGSEEIFYNYELNFNDSNTIFVYHK